MSWGILYGVGLGPGDPELMTLKACRVLTRVPVIFYPAYDENTDHVALRILQQALTQQDAWWGSRESGQGGQGAAAPGASLLARCRPLSTAMARGAHVQRPHWDEAAQVVGHVLQGGQDAAFITEGDPLLYSTFIHLREALAAHCPEAPVEVIPGVSSVTAAAARAGFALARADERVAVIPATYDPDDLARTIVAFDTVILLKVSRVLDRLIDILTARDLLHNAVLVERCGMPEERIVRDLASLRGQRVSYFSVILVRHSCA
jgi:precorrin-2/cobalt-factor-2 C20-methyltransferase